jgi:hypothetical protein
MTSVVMEVWWPQNASLHNSKAPRLIALRTKHSLARIWAIGMLKRIAIQVASSIAS